MVHKVLVLLVVLRSVSGRHCWEGAPEGALLYCCNESRRAGSSATFSLQMVQIDDAGAEPNGESESFDCWKRGYSYELCCSVRPPLYLTDFDCQPEYCILEGTIHASPPVLQAAHTAPIASTEWDALRGG